MAEMAMIASMAATTAAAGLSAAGTIASGKAEQESANFEARSMELKAPDERLKGQIQAQEYQRQTDLALSKLQTNAAASGFDPESIDIQQEAADIAQHGSLQSRLAQYSGDMAARDLRMGARVRRAEGKAAKKASKIKAFSTVLGAAGGMAGKFGSTATAPVSTNAPLDYGPYTATSAYG